MAKLSRGRFTSRIRGDVGPVDLPIPTWREIRVLSLDELHRVAGTYASELARERPVDHPAWLQQRLARVHTLIRQKERALEHKKASRRGRRRVRT